MTYGAPHIGGLHALLAAEEAVTLCAPLGVVRLKAEGAGRTPVALLPFHVYLYKLLSQMYMLTGASL